MITTTFPPLCPTGSLDDDDRVLLEGSNGARVLLSPLTEDFSHFIRVLSSPDTDELSYKIATRAETELDLADSFAHFKVGPCSLANLSTYHFEKFLAAHDKEKAIT